MAGRGAALVDHVHNSCSHHPYMKMHELIRGAQFCSDQPDGTLEDSFLEPQHSMEVCLCLEVPVLCYGGTGGDCVSLAALWTLQDAVHRTSVTL